MGLQDAENLLTRTKGRILALTATGDLLYKLNANANWACLSFRKPSNCISSAGKAACHRARFLTTLPKKIDGVKEILQIEYIYIFSSSLPVRLKLRARHGSVSTLRGLLIMNVIIIIKDTERNVENNLRLPSTKKAIERKGVNCCQGRKA